MSKKDRERAEKDSTIFRNGQLVKKEKCAFPPCSHHAWPKSKLGLCQTCDYVINLVAWFDKQMEAQEKAPRGPVLLVPKPGMSASAIAEEIKRKGGQR